LQRQVNVIEMSPGCIRILARYFLYFTPHRHRIVAAEVAHCLDEASAVASRQRPRFTR